MRWSRPASQDSEPTLVVAIVLVISCCCSLEARHVRHALRHTSGPSSTAHVHLLHHLSRYQMSRKLCQRQSQIEQTCCMSKFCMPPKSGSAPPASSSSSSSSLHLSKSTLSHCNCTQHKISSTHDCGIGYKAPWSSLWSIEANNLQLPFSSS